MTTPMIDNPKILAAWLALEEAQANLDAARDNMVTANARFKPGTFRAGEIGLTRLSRAEREWDEANRKYEEAIS